MLLEKLGLKVNLNGNKEEEDAREADCVALYESIQAAKKAWQDAVNMYQYAAEKDNIDALIHKIDACEREYIHLLKLARRESISVFPDVK
jgi:hypothetical protein